MSCFNYPSINFVDSWFLVNRKVVIHLQIKCIHPSFFSGVRKVFIHPLYYVTYLPTYPTITAQLAPLVCTLPFPSHAPFFEYFFKFKYLLIVIQFLIIILLSHLFLNGIDFLLKFHKIPIIITKKFR